MDMGGMNIDQVSMGYHIATWLWVVIFIFSALIAIFWLLLPFAVIGTNNRLDKIIGQNEDIKSLLQNLVYYSKPPEGEKLTITASRDD